MVVSKEKYKKKKLKYVQQNSLQMQRFKFKNMLNKENKFLLKFCLINSLRMQRFYFKNVELYLKCFIAISLDKFIANAEILIQKMLNTFKANNFLLKCCFINSLLMERFYFKNELYLKY